MRIDLRRVFEPVTQDADYIRPITTIICDVDGTLINEGKSLNEPLAEFLKWADENGATVIIASMNRDRAEQDIRRLDTKGLLSSLAIQHKFEVQAWFLEKDPSIVAVDDDCMVWFGAELIYNPTSSSFTKFVTEKTYETRKLEF